MNDYMAAIKNVMPFLLISLAASLICRVIFTLFADCNYRHYVINVISKTKEQLKSGDVLTTQTVSSQMFGDVKLGEKEIYKIQLSRRGGISVFVPMMGYMMLQIAVYAISIIIGG